MKPTKYDNALLEKVWYEELNPTWRFIFKKLSTKPSFHTYHRGDEYKTEDAHQKITAGELKKIFSLKKIRFSFYGDEYYDDEHCLNLEILQYFKELTDLDLGVVPLVNFSALAKCKQLERLYFDSRAPIYYILHELSSSKVFTSLKELKTLFFSGNIGRLEFDIRDIGQLTRLENLRLSDTRESLITDITPLNKLKHLYDLDISGTHVTNLQQIWDLPLQHLRTNEYIAQQEVLDYQKHHPETEVSISEYVYSRWQYSSPPY